MTTLLFLRHHGNTHCSNSHWERNIAAVICVEGLQQTFRNAICSFGSLCKVFVICRGYCDVGVLAKVWFYMCLHGTSKSILRWSVLYTCNYIHTREQTHYTYAYTDTYINNAFVGIVAVSAVRRLTLLFFSRHGTIL